MVKCLLCSKKNPKKQNEEHPQIFALKTSSYIYKHTKMGYTWYQ